MAISTTPSSSAKCITANTTCLGQPVKTVALALLDLSHKPFKVFSFGVRKACNEFEWSSWGQKRSVIALKKNVAFVYESGKFSLPASGGKLWNSIEPPHAGSGMTIEDVVPFAEELALP